MADLVPALDAWESIPYPSADYPPGSDEGEVEGQDLALLDGDIGAVLGCAILGGWDRLGEGDAILEHSIPALASVLPHLSPAGRAYFEPAMALLIEVRRRRAVMLATEVRGNASQAIGQPWFLVVGRPFPSMDPGYRGPDRRQPSIDESLGLSHPANRALLEAIDDPQGEYIRSEAAARRIARLSSRVADSEPLEVIWVGDPEAESDHELLGFDVLIVDGDTSLLAALLLQSDSLSWRRTDEELRLRSMSLDRLNEDRLFGKVEDARAFLDAATASGPWEGPEISWWVRGIWFVDAYPTVSGDEDHPNAPGNALTRVSA